MDGLEHGGIYPFRVDVTPGCKSHPSLEHGSQVSDDIPEKVGRHDHIKGFWVFDKPHGQCIHQGHVSFNAGKILRHLMEHMIPKHHGIIEGVGLGAVGHPAKFLASQSLAL